MSVEAKAPTATKEDLIMRSVHGDEVRMPFSFFQRLRRFHTSWLNKNEQQKAENDSHK